jgi:anti-anti-sigma regulatory factor
MDSRQAFRTSLEDGVLIVELLTAVSSLMDRGLLNELDGVRQMSRSGQVHSVVVDLGQAPYFGSSMLEALRALWTDLRVGQGKMVLCNASEVGREILLVAKFDHLWPIVNTRADALALVKDAPPASQP